MEMNEGKRGWPLWELWARRLEPRGSDSGSFPGLEPCLPLTLRRGRVGGRAPLPLPAPSLGASGPTPPPPPPSPATAIRATHLERTMLIVTRSTSCSSLRNKDGAPGVPGRSWQGWAQLCGLGSRDAATWLPGNVAAHSRPGRGPRWLPGNVSQVAPLAGGGVPESPPPP